MPRDKDPIWDTVCERFSLNPVTETERRRVGKIVTTLKAKTATEAAIRVNCDKWYFMFPGATLTPDALVKHWDQISAFSATPGFPEMPSKKKFDRDQQYRCLELHGEDFLRQRCKNEGHECILDQNLKNS